MFWVLATAVACLLVWAVASFPRGREKQECLTCGDRRVYLDKDGWPFCPDCLNSFRDPPADEEYAKDEEDEEDAQ